MGFLIRGNLLPAGFYLLGGGGGEASPQKFYWRKTLELFQVKIFFDDDFKESMKVTMRLRFQPILNTIFSKFSYPLEVPKTFFSPPRAWLKIFFHDRLLR